MDLVLNNLQWLMRHKTKPNRSVVVVVVVGLEYAEG